MLILMILVWGMAAGWVAQVILREKKRSWGEALVVGLAGSFVGGAVISLIAGDGFAIRPSGVIGSIVGACLVLAVYTFFRKK
jgi:uncharacterized membrane protein YeaQ/YmgE (transglycosylase-associated protein family)